MKKIVITGAESSGKSTLASSLSEVLNLPLVSEYAREYIASLPTPYSFEDLGIIARHQLQLEDRAALSDSSCFICDTGLLVLKIWSEYKYGRIDPYIAQKWEHYNCDLYILPHYDIPYEEDILRENPDERHILFQLYKDTLELNKLNYLIVTGSPTERIDKSKKAVKALLLSDS